MATILKAGNVASGAQITSDATGILEIRTGTGAGTTAITVGTDQAVTFAAGTTVSSLTTSGAVSAGSLTVNSNNISAVNSLGFRNRIINGDMRIDQRNNGAVVTGEGYLVDRWRVWRNQSYDIQQVTDAPTGFSNSLRVTKTSTTQSTYGYLIQYIEGFNFSDLLFGTANARSVTLSFWVRSSVTGTFSAGLANSAENRNYPATYTISAANTWEFKTITIAGDTSGTWIGSTNGKGVGVWFNFGATGSGTANAWSADAIVAASSGSANLGTTNGATFAITGVQLEAGSVATPFERRDYGRELMMCQRYFQRVGATDAGDAVAVAAAFNTTDIYGVYNFKTTMRADPTGSASSAGALEYLSNGGAQVSSAIAFQLASPNQIEIASTQSSRTAGNAGWWRFQSAAAWIQFSAEL